MEQINGRSKTVKRFDKMKLKATNHKYSNHEERVYAVLKKSRKPRSTIELTKAFYNDPDINKEFGVKTPPRNAATSVRCTIEALKKKLVANDERVRIHKSERAGPHPVDFWLENKAVRPSA